MSEEVDADDAVLGSLTRALVDQAFALDRVFTRAVKEAARSGFRSHRHMRLALKAQALCRATIKILLTMQAAPSSRAEARPLCEGGAAKKLRISNEQTIESGKFPA